MYVLKYNLYGGMYRVKKKTETKFPTLIQVVTHVLMEVNGVSKKVARDLAIEHGPKALLSLRRCKNMKLGKNKCRFVVDRNKEEEWFEVEKT